MPKCFLLADGAGFIGRHLCLTLLTHGHHVRAIDRLSDQVHADASVSLPSDVELIHGDVRDANAVAKASHNASTFLIALATGFPVTVLIWSGVAGVNKANYDVARTMGASQRFLVLKVAIPAAMPSVFVGLFMSNRVIVLSDRPPRSRRNPRHRGDPRLAELRRETLGLLGLYADW